MFKKMVGKLEHVHSYFIHIYWARANTYLILMGSSLLSLVVADIKINRKYYIIVF